jgi:endonuclease YncB( thermonuclease family)
MKKILDAILISSLTLILCISNLSANEIFEATVTKVSDGDTIWVKKNKEIIKIRLGEIDAPELSQEYGKKSKNYLEKLILNKKIIVNSTIKDKYGRTIAVIFFNDKNINKEMVQNGLAWVYDRYVKDKSFYDAQNEAKAKKINIWSDINPTEPWVYRKTN